MKTVTLTTCSNSVEANMLKDLLADKGINCFLTNENFSNLMPHLNGILGSGIQVIIDKKDLTAALAVLHPGKTEVTTYCPYCNSANVTTTLGQNKFRKIAVVILSLFIWIPFGNIKNLFICNDCKSKFKEDDLLYRS